MIPFGYSKKMLYANNMYNWRDLPSMIFHPNTYMPIQFKYRKSYKRKAKDTRHSNSNPYHISYYFEQNEKKKKKNDYAMTEKEKRQTYKQQNQKNKTWKTEDWVKPTPLNNWSDLRCSRDTTWRTNVKIKEFAQELHR